MYGKLFMSERHKGLLDNTATVCFGLQGWKNRGPRSGIRHDVLNQNETYRYTQISDQENW